MTTFIDSPLVRTAVEFAVDDGGRADTRITATTSLKSAFSRTPTIADQYSGLLDDLSPAQRRGLIARLSVGYYDGWRPSRAELAKQIYDELGVTTLAPKTGKFRPFRNHLPVSSSHPKS